MNEKFSSFSEFYPYYLEEHKNKTTKLFHFIGSLFFLFFLISFCIDFEIKKIAYAFLSAYGMAWFSHFFVEKNKPATFYYPIYSFMGDCLMFVEIIAGKHKVL